MIRRLRPPLRAAAGPAVEVALALAVVAACGILGRTLGWAGPPKHATSTALWPFYFDTWPLHSPVNRAGVIR